jgi:hypothetical protein
MFHGCIVWLQVNWTMLSISRFNFFFGHFKLFVTSYFFLLFKKSFKVLTRIQKKLEIWCESLHSRRSSYFHILLCVKCCWHIQGLHASFCFISFKGIFKVDTSLFDIQILKQWKFPSLSVCDYWDLNLLDDCICCLICYNLKI